MDTEHILPNIEIHVPYILGIRQETSCYDLKIIFLYENVEKKIFRLATVTRELISEAIVLLFEFSPFDCSS